LRLPRRLFIPSANISNDHLLIQNAPSISLKCTGGQRDACGAILAKAYSVLSFQHSWNVGRGTEIAWFIDNVSNVQESQTYSKLLAQGPIDVANISCLSCQAQVGWKFCADRQPNQPNAHQIGRYGLVLSSFRLSNTLNTQQDDLLSSSSDDDGSILTIHDSNYYQEEDDRSQHLSQPSRLHW